MPKLAAAIMTGTIARPSRPTARFTARPAPTRGRALFGDRVRCRAAAGNGVALAMSQPEMIGDPGPKQEHEQRPRRHRPAVAEGDVAKHVEQAAEDAKTRNRVGKLDQPVKHSGRPYHAAWLRRLWRGSAPGAEGAPGTP